MGQIIANELHCPYCGEELIFAKEEKEEAVLFCSKCKNRVGMFLPEGKSPEIDGRFVC